VLDLSERKRAEADLREVQTELAHSNRTATMGQLTASIAHEVQQPIAAVVTYAAAASRWLGVRPPNLDELRQALDGIVYEAMRAGGIVSGIRDLVKKAPPRRERVDINEAVREVIELTRGEAAKNDVSVLTVLGDGLPLVLGDRVQLQQVMLNLIVNAIEAMNATSEGPRALLVSTATDSSMGVLIAVSDSGPGLPADGINHVFDPFYTTKESGLGMGLSICRSIIDAHGGQLSAKANVSSADALKLRVSFSRPPWPSRAESSMKHFQGTHRCRAGAGHRRKRHTYVEDQNSVGIDTGRSRLPRCECPGSKL
jgi:C4-dicarboxylate-specific signal transduction histidine kinase